MTDLQELIALGPMKAKRRIPPKVLSPDERRLRDTGQHEAAGGFSEEDVEILLSVGLDPEASSLRRLPVRS